MPQSRRDFGTRDAQVLERIVEHPERLVAIAIGADEVGIFLDVAANGLAMLLELEEVVALLDALDRSVVHRADVAGEQFLFGVEALAADAVEAFIVLEIDVAAFIAAREHLLHERLMHRVGGADENIVADVERGPGVAKEGADVVGERLRLEPQRFRRALVLVAVLVGAGDEGDVAGAELAALEAGEGVGRQQFVGVADMRRPVAVSDRAGDVDAGVHLEDRE